MTRKLQVVFLVAGALFAPSAALATGPFDKNLLTNPGAETGDMTGWTIMENGGDGWAARASYVHSGTYAFATSWWWDTRYQMIDLLAAGFTAEELDVAPTIVLGEWVRSTMVGCEYFIRFELLDADQQVIAEWHHGDQDNPVTLPANTDYFLESHSFSSYGPGVRYIKLIDGGKDTAFWEGWYGAYFDDASAMVVSQPFNTNLLENPGAETGDMTGWTITANGGDGWAARTSGPRTGSYAFATSYEWDTRYQMIDLLAAGFTAGQLDATPTVVFSEWIRSTSLTACEYFIRFELLDADQEVIAEWHHGDQDNPITLAHGTPYTLECHSFSSYGPGLRYLKFIDGGKDVPWWVGWYGAYFDDAVAMLVPRPECPADTDGDGDVDTADLLALLGAWGACP